MKKYIFLFGILIAVVIFLPQDVFGISCPEWCTTQGQGYTGGECPTGITPVTCCRDKTQCNVYGDNCQPGDLISWHDTGASNGCSFWGHCWCYGCSCIETCCDPGNCQSPASGACSVGGTTCNAPTGTLIAAPYEVQVNQPIYLTVYGQDDNDIEYLWLQYPNGTWVKDKCWGEQTSCSHEFSADHQSTPGTYTYHAKVEDSDNVHGCPSSHTTDLTPQTVTVISEKTCNDTDNGKNWDVKGTCTSDGTSNTDYCGGDPEKKNLVEFFCDPNKYCQYEVHVCSGICDPASGACKPAPQTCNNPTGVFSAAPSQVQVGQTIYLDVYAYDDNDVYSAEVYYGGQWHEAQCLLEQKECHKSWTISESTPGTYTYKAKITDSDDTPKYNCPSRHTINLIDQTVIVSGERTCNDTDNGKKWDVKGTCTHTGGEPGTDYCAAATNLVEFYCDGQNYCQYELHDCSPGSCQNGVCTGGGQTCSWQNDNCGQSPCTPTQKHQTCGPAGCQSGVCTAGQTQCVSDPSCTGAVCVPNGCNGNCPSGCTVAQDPDCGCANNNGCCGIGCTSSNDNDCGGGACIPNGCNGNCPSGCTVAQDPDCGCANNNGCCVIGCTSANDNDCAGGGTSSILSIESPINATSFEAVVGNVIDFIFKIAVILAPLMILVGGVLFITAGGNLPQIDQAKRLLLWTAIGFAIVLLSKGILVIINLILGVK